MPGRTVIRGEEDLDPPGKNNPHPGVVFVSGVLNALNHDLVH
ncbi:MAG: hypothetical protein ACJ0BN_04980 [Limisphaerales bacterium]